MQAIFCCVGRTYDNRQPNWLITIATDFHQARDGKALIQARACIDDFGDLVLVTGWH